MSNIVFVTKWSDYYEAPLVEVFMDGRSERVTCAVPLNAKMRVEDENGRSLTEETARKVGYASMIASELQDEKYNLAQFHIDAIVEFLLQSDNFSAFDKKMHPKEVVEQKNPSF